MNRVSRYRKHAEACREQAARATSDEERRLLHELAGHWEAMAAIYDDLSRVTPKPSRPA